jgi:hypothetical protein
MHQHCKISAPKMNFFNSLRPPSSSKKLVSLEVAFDDSKSVDSYTEYKPFCDVHMQKYWNSPITRRRLIQVGFLNSEGTKLLEPDKERRKFATAEQLIQAARQRISVQETKRRNRLIAESTQLQRKIVSLMKYEHVQSDRMGLKV